MFVTGLGLFGDGAGAAVLSRNAPTQCRSIEWKSFASLVNPAERNALLFETRKGMLRNVLTRPVPGLAAGHAEQVLRTVLDTAGLTQADIGTWIMHAGGRDVLHALRQRLKLSPNDLRYQCGPHLSPKRALVRFYPEPIVLRRLRH